MKHIVLSLLFLGSFASIFADKTKAELSLELKIDSFSQQKEAKPHKSISTQDQKKIHEFISLYRKMPKDCDLFLKLAGSVPMKRVHVFQGSNPILDFKVFGQRVQCSNSGFSSKDIAVEKTIVEAVDSYLKTEK